jgi:hypothetical protein
MGSLLAGSLWESAGPQTTFSLSAVVSFIAAIIIWRWHDRAYD